jgi:rhodanese-related sulfurtransferase
MEQIMSLPKISAEEAKRLIDQGAVLIDIRGPQEHAGERIPGAHNRPLGQAMTLEASGPIVFHCKSGQRTAANAASLAQLANCEAYILDGGIDAWKRAGLAVEGDTIRPAAGASGWRGIAKALGVMSSDRRAPRRTRARG